MARRRGPWRGQIGGGTSMSIGRSFGVTAVLHRRQTHSGCHSLLVRWRVGAHSMCRVGSCSGHAFEQPELRFVPVYQQ